MSSLAHYKTLYIYIYIYIRREMLLKYLYEFHNHFKFEYNYENLMYTFLRYKTFEKVMKFLILEIFDTSLKCKTSSIQFTISILMGNVTGMTKLLYMSSNQISCGQFSYVYRMRNILCLCTS